MKIRKQLVKPFVVLWVLVMAICLTLDEHSLNEYFRYWHEVVNE